MLALAPLAGAVLLAAAPPAAPPPPDDGAGAGAVYVQPAAATDPDAPPDVRPEDLRPPRRFALAVTGSFGYDFAASSHFLSGIVEISLGGYLRNGIELGARIGVRAGRTASGLTFQSVTAPAFVLSVPVHRRVRVGVGVGGLAPVFIQRVTQPSTHTLLSFEVLPSLEVALYRGETATFMAQLHAGFMGLLLDDGFHPGARIQAGLGCRY